MLDKIKLEGKSRALDVGQQSGIKVNVTCYLERVCTAAASLDSAGRAPIERLRSERRGTQTSNQTLPDAELKFLSRDCG